MHDDVFDDLAAAEAMQISEIFQEQLDGDLLLQTGHGDEPQLAYFELAANEETDAGEFLDGVVKLKTAGYDVAQDQIEEKTGYQISAPGYQIQGLVPPSAALMNRKGNTREEFEEAAITRLAELMQAAGAPFAQRVQRAISAGNFEELKAELDGLDEALAVSAPSENELEFWEELLATSYVNGLGDAGENAGLRNNCGTGKGGFKGGNQCGKLNRISSTQADQQLMDGFKVKAADGAEVNFGERLKKKLETAPDGTARKERLPLARRAVAEGTRKEVTVNGENRVLYGKIFSEEGRAKGLLVIVDATDAEAFNFYALRPNALKKRLQNRDGRDSGEQPPVAVLMAYAAAGDQLD